MKKKVLVVDDSCFIHEEMKLMLEDTGFEIVAYCKYGEDAIEKYEELCPDVVTMDIILPGLDGLDATDIILKKWPSARILIVSSLAYDETMESAKKVGAKGFIFKPFEKHELVAALINATAEK